MPHTYSSAYPAGIEVDPGIESFFENFYQVSDTKSKHEEYASQFTDDATIVIASKGAVGREDILAFRKSMWEHVSSRLHTTPKIFPFGSRADELMLYGRVEYELKDGRKSGVDWAARANLVQDGGRWKLKYYQVYLDPTAAQNAK